IFILMLSWLFFREKVSGIQVIGMLISLLGVVTVVTQGNPETLLSLDLLNVGTAWILAAVLSWAIYSALLRLRPEGISPFGFFGLTVVIGVVALLPFYLYETSNGRPMPVTPVSILSVLYVGIFPSI
ncbi:hypothetical protein BTA35_0217625, partial [Oceanospirillum linum]